MKPVAFIWSSVLHVVLLAAVIVGLPWRLERPPPVLVAAPIQGVIIDQAAIERERAKQEAAARQVRLQQQREDRQRREAAEQQRLADQRIADQRARDEAQRKEEQRLADERAEQRRRDEQAKAEREAQATREREEAAKRERERAAQRQREEEMLAAAAAEAEATAARAAGLLDQYMLMIESHVTRHWERPLSARPGIECVVSVVQLPTGDVVSAKVDRCNGDEAVRRSIESAVLRASPLPRPPSQAVFSRTFTLTFAPDK